MHEAIDTTRHRLIAWIAVTTVLMWATVIFDLERGGRPDPSSQRAAATLLDGNWRFHTGDDPRWADASSDVAGWETTDLTAAPGSHDGDGGLPDYVRGWMAHGHPDHTGYAWYRRTVDVPSGGQAWDILGPTLVEDGYELYWNGDLLGGSGRLGPDPRVVGTRPMRFALPPEASGKKGVLAIRAFMLPQSAASADGGGLHSAPILAPRPVSDELYRAQWERTIAGYIVDVVEPLAMTLLIGLLLWLQHRSVPGRFLRFAAIALALTAVRRLANAIVAWTDLVDLTTYAWLAEFLWMPTVAAWALAWNRWCGRPSRLIDASALAIAIAEVAGSLAHAGGVTGVSRLASIALFVVLGVRTVRNGPMRALATVAWALITLVSFGSELLDPIGAPGIWFPFGIGVSRTQYLYATIVPMIAFLIVTRAPGRRPS